MGVIARSLLSRLEGVYQLTGDASPWFSHGCRSRYWTKCICLRGMEPEMNGGLWQYSRGYTFCGDRILPLRWWRTCKSRYDHDEGLSPCFAMSSRVLPPPAHLAPFSPVASQITISMVTVLFSCLRECVRSASSGVDRTHSLNSTEELEYWWSNRAV